MTYKQSVVFCKKKQSLGCVVVEKFIVIIVATSTINKNELINNTESEILGEIYLIPSVFCNMIQHEAQTPFPLFVRINQALRICLNTQI